MTYELKATTKNDGFSVHFVPANEVLENKVLSDEFVRLFNVLTDSEKVYHEQQNLTLNGIYTRDCILDGLKTKDGVFFLKSNDGHIIGECEVGTSRYIDTLALSGLVIESNYRGRGLGKRILDAVFTHYKNKNIVLTVSVANPHAVNLYRSLGFKDTDIRMVRYAN